MIRLLLPLLLLASASAAPVDILPSIYKDGVFRSSLKVPAEHLPPNSTGVQLAPYSYGGEWQLNFSGPKTLATSVQISYASSKTLFAANSAAVAKLTGRLAGTIATGCFNVGAERLSALRGWLDEKVRAGVASNITAERSFGPLRVQLLTNHAGGEQAELPSLAELDVILSRTGTPEVAPWLSSCKK